MSSEKKDRLFVPLCTDSFLDFKLYGKQYEIRACEKAYSEKYVFPGRPVELRKGYGGESLKGAIGHVFVGSLEHIMSQVDYRLVEPQAHSESQAINLNKIMLGERPKYITFQILFDYLD
jgi:hypothetical protein